MKDIKKKLHVSRSWTFWKGQFLLKKNLNLSARLRMYVLVLDLRELISLTFYVIKISHLESQISISFLLVILHEKHDLSHFDTLLTPVYR